MTRDEAIDRLWEKTEPVVYIGKDQFIAALNGWDIVPFFNNGALVYIKMVKGDEFHFEFYGERITPAMVRECVVPILTEHGRVRTKTAKDDTRMQKFNKLIGFVPEGEDEYFIHYRMDKFRLDRRVSCQQ